MGHRASTDSHAEDLLNRGCSYEIFTECRYRISGFDEGFRQEAPLLGNTFINDTSLQLFLKRHLSEATAKELFPSLERVRALAAGELHELSHIHRNDDPQHISFDARGNRVDDVELNPAWSRFFEVAAEEGLIAEAYERRHGDCSRLMQFSKVYLLDRSMQVSTCHTAMTDGTARNGANRPEDAMGDDMEKEALLTMGCADASVLNM